MNKFALLCVAAAGCVALSPSLIAQGRPVRDLIAQAISVSNTNPLPTERISFNTGVFNAGNLSASNVRWGIFLSQDDRITAGDSLVAEGTISFLGSFGSQSVTGSFAIPPQWPASTSYVGIFVDYENRITEPNETNNKRSTEITVQGFPDLVVEDVVLRSGSVRAGQSARFEVTVVNRGNVDAGSGRNPARIGLTIGPSTSMRASDHLLGSVFEVLRPLERVTRTVHTQVPIGIASSQVVKAVADIENLIPELSERNNIAREAVFVEARPLSTKAIEYQPRLGSFATHPGSAVVAARLGGHADMIVAAPQFANGTYVCVWSLSTTFEQDAATQLSLDLANTSVLPAWIGTLDTDGHAFPAITLPPLDPSIDVQFFTHVGLLAPGQNQLDFGARPIAFAVAPSI